MNALFPRAPDGARLTWGRRLTALATAALGLYALSGGAVLAASSDGDPDPAPNACPNLAQGISFPAWV